MLTTVYHTQDLIVRETEHFFDLEIRTNLSKVNFEHAHHVLNSLKLSLDEFLCGFKKVLARVMQGFEITVLLKLL